MSMYTHAEALTKSDSTIVPSSIKALYVGGAGDVAVVMLDDSSTASAVTFKAVPVGTILPIRVQKLMSTNTSATLVLGLA